MKLRKLGLFSLPRRRLRIENSLQLVEGWYKYSRAKLVSVVSGD